MNNYTRTGARNTVLRKSRLTETFHTVAQFVSIAQPDRMYMVNKSVELSFFVFPEETWEIRKISRCHILL